MSDVRALAEDARRAADELVVKIQRLREQREFVQAAARRAYGSGHGIEGDAYRLAEVLRDVERAL